jgi:hypothetical protein
LKALVSLFIRRIKQPDLYRNSIPVLFLLFLSIVFTLIHSNNFFFWDTISQISVPANWYYDTNFHSFFLPDDIATGHPTFAGMYVALLWKVFGKTLLVSHLAMVPFIFGILYQIKRYLESADLNKRFQWLILAITVIDATLVSQMSMVSFDTIQIFFFLWSVNSVILNKKLSLAFAFTGLCLISLRGTICAGGILIFNLLYTRINSGKISLKTIYPYSLGIITFLIFLLAFYLDKHWIIHNVVSKKWQQSSEIASFNEIIRNTGIIGWRLIDYGRTGLWIVFGLIIFKAVRKGTLYDDFFRNTLLIALTQLIIFLPVLIFSRNFIGHRYLLPVIIPVAICTIYQVFRNFKKPLLISVFIITILISGYFMVYPKTIAQGWDATPAHWPYYEIRKEMIAWMKSDSIPVQQTGSFFPNLASFKLTDLSDETTSFKEADLSKDNYVLFSNVFNVPDHKIEELYTASCWKEVKKIDRMNVYMILFKKVQLN